MIALKSFLTYKHKGQALIEMAFCFLIFFTLMFGTIQFFIVLQNRTALEAAATTAILQASVYRFPDQLEEAEEKARSVLQSSLRRSSFIPANHIDSIRVSIDMQPQELIVGSETNRQFYVVPISLHVNYDMDLILPIVRYKIPLKATVHSLSEYIEER